MDDDDPVRVVWARKKVLERVSLAVVMIALAAIGAGCGDVRRGVFVGPVVAQSGICGLSATAAGVMEGSLSMRDGLVVFAPETGVVSVPGKIDGAGHVVAGAVLTGADHKPFTVAFEGDLIGDRVTGIYATPRCRAGVALERAR